jgi:hypothetical protein
MSGPIVRSGPSPEFSKNWDSVFGKKSGGTATSAAKKSAKKPLKKAAQKPAPKKAKKSGK